MAAILKAISDLNVSPFEASMGRIEKRVDRFANGQLAQLGRTIGTVFSVYAVGRFAASIGKAADELANISDATGVGVENLQALNVLFIEGGKSAADVSSILARLKKNMDEATVEEKIARSWQRLGIAFADVANKSPEALLEQIATALRDNAGDMEMGEAAGNLLGRSYAELQGIMNDLAAQGLDPLRESLKSTNQIMSEDSVRAADQMQKAYDKLGRTVGTTLRGALVKTVQGIQAAGAFLGSGGDWGVVADTVFGAPESGGDPLANKADADRRRASADAMGRAVNRRGDQAKASADDWLKSAMDRITVGGVSAADSLAGIGGYVGGQASPAAQIMERQLKVLELQKTYQERIAKATAAAEINTGRIAEAVEE